MRAWDPAGEEGAMARRGQVGQDRQVVAARPRSTGGCQAGFTRSRGFCSWREETRLTTP